MIHHFILTRFNLRLWGADKNGIRINRETWLKERVTLFETYTLPSIAAQSCKTFTWVLLMDGESPKWMHDKAKEWKRVCPQIRFVGVNPQHHRYFARVFQSVVNGILVQEHHEGEELTILTTYLDNDDAVRTDFVEDIQRVAKGTEDGTFVYYDYGLQYFTEIGISTRVCYPNNHFTTLVERIVCSSSDAKHGVAVKTCYGYGSHFLVERDGVAKVKHVVSRGKPMWVEVIHGGNVDNDVKMTFDTKLWLKGNDCYGCVLRQSSHPWQCFIKQWIPQMIGQVVRRAKDKIG